MGGAGDGHRALLHAFEQGGLGLRGGAVHLVGEQDVAEDRAPLELEVLPALRVLHDDVGADDVTRHQVRRELDARERELEALGEGLDQERLAETGHAFQQDVPTREQADHDLPDHLGVADDHLAHLGPERLVGVDELPDPLLL